MREPNDLSVLQMPSVCPWCMATLKLEGNSLYMQMWNYACHVTSAKACVCTYTGILEGNEVKDQAFPNVRDLLSVKDKQAVWISNRTVRWSTSPERDTVNGLLLLSQQSCSSPGVSERQGRSSFGSSLWAVLGAEKYH